MTRASRGRFVVTGYVVAFPMCVCGTPCRLAWVSVFGYARSAYRASVAVWPSRPDAERAARAFLRRSREAFRVVAVGRYA